MADIDLDQIARAPVVEAAQGAEPQQASRPSGRGPILVAVAVVGLLVVVAAVGGVVYIFLRGATQRLAGSIVTAQPSVIATRTAPSADATISGEKVDVPVSNQDVFTFRDPFKPVVQPVQPATSAVATSTGDPSLLTLENIVMIDGVNHALLQLGSTLYTVAAGEQLGSSPWQVLTIDKSSVTLLFGEDQVTLTLGEGVQKQ